MTDYDCPWCEAELSIDVGFNTDNPLGHEFHCPHCGKPCEIEGDYLSEGNWYFSVTRGSDNATQET